MKRREFLSSVAVGAAGLSLPWMSWAAEKMRASNRYVVLVELKGGNDGLNTLVPYANPTYYEYRPKLAIARDQVVQLTEQVGLHPQLAAWKPLWDGRELAVLQSIGYPQPSLSHFRSIEIWDTASRSDQTLSDGWLTRAFARDAFVEGQAADGVLIGNAELGPFVGGARAVTLANPSQFVNQARLVHADGRVLPGALGHVVKVESDVVRAAAKLGAQTNFKTEFSQGPFGDAIKATAQVLATGSVPVVRVTLNGFDTHQNQLSTQAKLLEQLSEGMLSLRSAMQEIGRWDNTLVVTYAEFGRRPKENASAGTDHGTAGMHFAFGGRVKGGLYGAPANLQQLDSSGNVGFALDFRQLYASLLSDWWGMDASKVLSQRFETVPFFRA
jgi:uncharacterized protein (DUF1501 family)